MKMIPSLYITCVHEITINDVKYDNIPNELDEFIHEYKKLYKSMKNQQFNWSYQEMCIRAFYWKYNNVANKLYHIIPNIPKYHGLLLDIASYIGDFDKVKQIYSECKTFYYNFENKYSSDKDCEPFINAVGNNHFNIADYILNNIEHNDMLLKRYACDIARKCNKKSIKYLIKIGVNFDNNETISYYDDIEYNFIAEFINGLSCHNNIKCIKYLYNKLNLFIGYDDCFRDAIYNGHRKVLKYLFKRGSTTDDFESFKNELHDGILCSDLNKMYKVIKFLVEHGLTQANKNIVLEYAINADAQDIILLLN